MRRRPPRASVALFVSGLILAVVTTLLLRSYLDRLGAQAAAAGPGTQVVVAAVDLVRGTALTPELLTISEVPDAYVPPGAIASVGAIVGHHVATDLLAGEIVTRTRLAPPGGPVASLVPSGLRAVAFAAGVPPGIVAPGDRVDVLATFPTGPPRTETVIEGAEVLQVRAASGGETFGEASTLVVLVDPATATRVAHARAFAELSVSLAPPDEPAS